MKKAIFIIFLVGVVAAGVYFQSDIVRLYNEFDKNFRKTIGDFKKTDIDSLISDIKREIFAPPPLRVFAPEKPVVLTVSKVILETNLQRQAHGLSVLKENARLSAAAAAKANDMFQNQYFEHVSPLGLDPGELLSQHGYQYVLTGENLILGNFSGEKDMVQQWMNSPGHRENILNRRFTEIGVAVVKGVFEGNTVWIGVQEFGLPLSSCLQPSAVTRSQIEQNKIQLDRLSSEIEQKKREIENSRPRSPGRQQLTDEYNRLVESYNVLLGETKILVSQYNNEVSVFNGCLEGR